MLKFIDLHTGYETDPAADTVLCLGNFDGVHLGHSELIRQAVSVRNELKRLSPEIIGGAWCFRQPPAVFLSGKPQPQLTTLDEKLSLFSDKGLDIAILGDFSELASLSPSKFVEQTLKAECRCISAVCGFNFRFGQNAAGSFRDLVGLKHGSYCVQPVIKNDTVVSSSLIRELLSKGDVDAVSNLLGRNYSMTSIVSHGKGLGRKLGIPTINLLFPKNKAIPLFGVYACLVRLEAYDRPFIAVGNVGDNPTLGGESIRCEVHILDFDGDLYDKNVAVEFCHRIRNEIRFQSIELLADTIKLDIESTREYFKK